MTRWLVAVDTRIVIVLDSDATTGHQAEKDLRGRLAAGDRPDQAAELDWSLVRVVVGSGKKLEDEP